MPKVDMKAHMAKLRAMKGKSGKRGKGSRNAKLRSEVKTLTKLVKDQGKTLARMAKHVIPRPKAKKKV